MKIHPKSHLVEHIPVVHGGRNSLNLASDIIDFSSNITPLGSPPSVDVILKKNLRNIQHYPDFNSSAVISSLKNYTGLSQSNIVVGNGAIEIIYNFCLAFLSEKTKVLIPIPTFQEYETAAKLNNSKISFFKTMNLSNDIALFISQIPHNGCIFICNPNNPTGTLLSKTKLLSIIKAAKKCNSFVFVDECFIELVPEHNESVMSYVKQYDNLFVLRSLTKSFGLAGLRIGYGIASQPIIKILQKIKIPWSINLLAQEAAVIALKDNSHLTKSQSIIKKESIYLKNRINKLNDFQCYDSTTNFILIKTKHNSTKLQQQLLKHKLLIRDCKNFRGLDNHHIRIAIKSHKDNLKLVKALEQIK